MSRTANSSSKEQPAFTLRQFTALDWDTFAGCERHADAEPMIATWENGNEDEDWTAVVDAQDTQFYMNRRNGDWSCWSTGLNYRAGCAFVRGLTEADMEALTADPSSYGLTNLF